MGLAGNAAPVILDGHSNHLRRPFDKGSVSGAKKEPVSPYSTRVPAHHVMPGASVVRGAYARVAGPGCLCEGLAPVLCIPRFSAAIRVALRRIN